MRYALCALLQSRANVFMDATNMILEMFDCKT
jgi:hypothetical protein